MIASIFLFNFCDIIQFPRFLNNDISYFRSEHSISGLLFVLRKNTFLIKVYIHMLCLYTTLVTTWRGVVGSISMHWHWWSFEAVWRLCFDFHCARDWPHQWKYIEWELKVNLFQLLAYFVELFWHYITFRYNLNGKSEKLITFNPEVPEYFLSFVSFTWFDGLLMKT